MKKSKKMQKEEDKNEKRLDFKKNIYCLYILEIVVF